MPEFADPRWLWLALLLPAVVALRRRGGRPESRARRAVGTALRCVALATLIVALAGPLSGAYSRYTDVVFALDVSRSIGREAGAQALAFVNRAFATRAPGARMGLVVFGADAALETPLREGGEPVRDIAAEVSRDGTDIGRAIEVAVGAFPAGQGRRVVLLSDGRENLGQARQAAAVARSIGVEILTIGLHRDAVEHEVHVRGIEVPRWVHVHEPFTVRTTLHSKARSRVHLIVVRNGAVIRDAELELEPGANVHDFVEQASEPGLYEYEVVVNSPQDSEQENNRYQAFLQVRGAPRVLHAVGDPGGGRHVGAALRAQGLSVEEVPGHALPGSMQALVDHDLVILDNVSGLDLSVAKMELLESYVRDAGGGLIMLGGDASYGAGGYLGTPVERLLPVTMDVRSEVRIPSLAVFFVLDRSGSMGSVVHGEEKLTLAKGAAIAAIELLNRLDRVGVLAFDSAFEWAVPPTEVGMRSPIARRLRDLGPGGGTDLYQALEEAHRALVREQAKIKHLIVLSDGLSDGQKDFDTLGRRITGDGITVSTVALGADADRELMERIAALGRGRYYFTDDPRNIPRIFTNETLVVSRDLVVERETRPLSIYPGEPLEGFAPGTFPVLAGYQRTFAKPSAQVLLGSDDGDPLLVTWRYGLGKSAAFTSDLTGRWGREWVAWEQFGRFVGQLARWTLRRSGTESLLARFAWEGRRGEVIVDALDRDERFVNGLDLQAVVVDPRRRSRRVALEQVAPGRYRGDFEVPESGRYYVTLDGRRGDLRVGPETYGLAVPYSSEYLDLGVDERLLRDLAASTGGRMLPLAQGSLAAVTAPGPAAVTRRWRVWWPLLAGALVLLVLEVAARKLIVPPPWRARWARLTGRPLPDADTGAGHEALRTSIERARERDLRALRDGVRPDAHDPVARARMHLAGPRRR